MASAGSGGVYGMRADYKPGLYADVNIPANVGAAAALGPGPNVGMAGYAPMYAPAYAPAHKAAYPVHGVGVVRRPWDSAGAILVLFILLVIISRARTI